MFNPICKIPRTTRNFLIRAVLFYVRQKKHIVADFAEAEGEHFVLSARRTPEIFIYNLKNIKINHLSQSTKNEKKFIILSVKRIQYLTNFDKCAIL